MDAIVRLLVGSVALTLVLALLGLIGVKFFARGLPYSKAFLVALKGFAVVTLLYIGYYFVKATAGWSDSVDGLCTLVGTCVAGTIITKLAKNYGVEKTGWIGIGAKSIFVVFALGWLLVGIAYVGLKLNS